MEIYDPTYLGLQVAKSMGTELSVFCPYHFDTNPSAEYNIEKGLFYCFGCHESKTAKQLADDTGGSLVPMRIIPDEYRERPGDDLGWTALMRTKRAVRNKYLSNRLVKDWQVERFDIRENEDGVLFPQKDRFGKIRGMQIRHYDRRPKYMFHGQRSSLWPTETLMAPSRREGQPIIITEGAFGALRIGASEDIVAAAIMGSSSIDRAVKTLQQMSYRTPYALMDMDWAGLVAAGKFILHGVPALLLPKDWPDSPDGFGEIHRFKMLEGLNEYATLDIMNVVERSDNPNKMQRTLEKYWRKMK